LAHLGLGKGRRPRTGGDAGGGETKKLELTQRRIGKKISELGREKTQGDGKREGHGKKRHDKRVRRLCKKSKKWGDTGRRRHLPTSREKRRRITWGEQKKQKKCATKKGGGVGGGGGGIVYKNKGREKTTKLGLKREGS